MSYDTLLTAEHLAKLQQWLDETGELYVDVYCRHSGGGGTPYLVRSLKELQELVSGQTCRKLVVSVFRGLQYPLRGVADDALLAQALQQIPDGRWYSMILLEDYYPSQVSYMGSGDSHAEMRQDFAENAGLLIGFGENPFDYHCDDWMRAHPDEVLCVEGTQPNESP